METETEHQPRDFNGRTVCTCGDFNCASLDALPRPIPGNLDPWSGPVDPRANARWRDRFYAEAKRDARNQDPCGCWRSDCAECGAKIADGKRSNGSGQRFTRHAGTVQP